jgi:hypothetical protein
MSVTISLPDYTAKLIKDILTAQVYGSDLDENDKVRLLLTCDKIENALEKNKNKKEE